MLLLAASSFAAADDASPPAEFRIDAPRVVLADVPVSAVRIEALNAGGQLLADYAGSPQVEGVRIQQRGSTEPLPLPAFNNGVLELRTDLSRGEKVYVTDKTIAVEGASATATVQVHRLPWWIGLVPPVVAIVLAILVRNVLIALFIATWSGAALLLDSGANWYVRVLEGFVDALESVVLPQLADPDHLAVVMFTLFLGCMVGVMSGSGGTSALVHRLAGVTGSRRRTQMTTSALGLLIFFDDYANSLLIGSTMRPVTDRVRISREKLAFLVDATAAPVAGLAIVSTWIGIEVGLIDQTFHQLSQAYGELNWQWDAYAIFLETLPYRFYPILLLAFVVMIAWSGRDFGPMRAAEQRAFQHTPHAETPAAESSRPTEQDAAAGSMWNAIIPLIVLFGLLIGGFWFTGRASIIEENLARAAGGEDPLPVSLREIISHADSYRVLLISAFVASLSGVFSAVATRALSLQQGMDAWLEGARSMLLGVTVLVLAWSVSAVCDASALNTAGALVEMTENLLAVHWMPAIAFVLSALVAFATGTSWATMSLLIPIVMSITAGLLIQDGSFVTAGTVNPGHPLLLAAIGGVLAGSIWGDHCSPISDTTVLSSVACDCDHLAHVWTQLPYALTVGLISLAIGCIPAGFGWPAMLLLPVALIVMWVTLRLCAKSPDDGKTT